MDFNAFSLIRNGLAEELEKQGFGSPQPLPFEEGEAVMFATEEVAYCLRYHAKAQQFELCSTTLTAEKQPGDWRRLSVWLFDSAQGTRSDAESILNDFLEVVRGPKRVAVVQQKKKRGKDDERTVDPQFFLNRLINIFPELREEMNDEKILYGQVRFVTFVKEKAVPKCQDLVLKYPGSDPCKKLYALLDDMYHNGDMDLRSILTIALLNSLEEEAFETVLAGVGEELQKDLKYTRKLRGKKIKPEKPKKNKGKQTEVRLQS